MKRSLRKAHLRRSLVLAVVLPLGCGVALWSRPEPPAPAAIEPDRPIRLVTTRSVGRSDATGLEARLAWPKVAEPGAPELLLESVDGAVSPDLLAYWTEDGASRPVSSYEDEGAPADLTLLGSVSSSSSFALPAGEAPFAVVFYSLAHAEYVDGIYDVEPER